MPGPPQTSEPSLAETDWPALLYDNARTGGQGVRPARAPDHVRWHIRMGGSVRSAPVLRTGVLYVTSMAGNLHAIDIEKGRQKWQFQAADHIHSTPSLSGNKVLFGCDSGKVYAVDRDSGKPAWETAAAAEVWTSPVIRHGVAFFGSADARMYAVEVDTGRKRWTQELGGRIYSTAWVGDDTPLPWLRRRQGLLPRCLIRQNGVEHCNGKRHRLLARGGGRHGADRIGGLLLLCA